MWMPRAKTTCARTPGHGGDCMTTTNMANRREYNRLHGHRESAESRKKSNRKYRIASYGLGGLRSAAEAPGVRLRDVPRAV
jgi:hypothetical protein